MRTGRRARARGLALLELLIVIVILTLLMVVVMPSYVVARSRGRLTACVSNVRNMATAIGIYQAEQKTLPLALDELVPRYMSTVPRCPSAGTQEVYRAGYTRVLVPEPAFTLSCTGSFHNDLRLPPGQPAYVPSRGLVCTPVP